MSGKLVAIFVSVGTEACDLLMINSSIILIVAGGTRFIFLCCGLNNGKR